MRRVNHLTRKDPSAHEWVLGDFSPEPEKSPRITVSEYVRHPSHRQPRRSPAFSLAAALAFFLHIAALLFLWQQLPSSTSAVESAFAPVTEVELAPPIDSASAPPEPNPSPQQEVQDFHASALARTESLEQTLTQAIAQQATTEATRQQQLDALTAAQTTLQGQVASLAEEKTDLAVQLDSERQRAQALAQQVQDIQQAREKELQGLKGTYDRLVAALQSEISQKEIALHQAQEQLTVTILDRVLFPSGQATLSLEGERVIEKVGTILAKVAGQRILIEGHTDNVPIGPALKARFPSNWELSSARAAEVVKYLLSHAQLSPQQLSAVGRAETSPVASNANEEGRKLNRRIEIIVLPSEERSQRRP
jgi:chemotaxis protein MotB